MREPTLLVGAEQSGTTLLRLMLDSHPEIAFAEEFGYAIEPIADDGAFPTTTEFLDHLSLQGAFATSGFPVDPDLDYPRLVNGFLRSRRDKTGATVVGATIHHGFSKALHLWPRARFIHLVRDPRDVAPARVAEGLAGNVWHGIDPWIRAEDEWARVAALIPTERRLTVHFDELIGDHDSALTMICRFLGVDYTAQMLDYSRDTDYTEPNPTIAGHWRDDASVPDVQLVEARVGDRLTRSGFSPSGLAPITVTGRRSARLRWHDRAARLMNRIGVFGIRLTVAEVTARVLRNEPLHRSVQLRCDRVEQGFRKKSWSEAKYRTSR